jgi:hypothetical protein
MYELGGILPETEALNGSMVGTGNEKQTAASSSDSMIENWLNAGGDQAAIATTHVT